MNEPQGERIGMLVLRLWRSPSEGMPPLGRIGRTTDVVNVPRSVTTVGSVAEIKNIVGEWLEAMLRPEGGVAPEPDPTERAGSHPD
jgi:hypothetical protein